MRTRRLYADGPEVGEVGFGAWAIGGDWGSVDDDDSLAALHTAIDEGVTFIDTADVYGDGRSEQLIGRVLRERDEDLVVATKMGRRDPDLDPGNWTHEQFAAWLERSRENLGVDTVDLVQLHCLGHEIYLRDRVWTALDRLREDGVVRAYGVSVESVDEGLAALDRGVASVQIIFNPFRMKPADEFLAAAAEAGVGVIVRVPLASGLLTGKFDADTEFEDDDHRRFNRDGEEFDVGETFAGVDFDTGLEAVERLRPLVPADATMAQFALRWILDHDAVSVVIPGAKRPDQARDNARASELEPLGDEVHADVRAVYDDLIRPEVHHRW